MAEQKKFSVLAVVVGWLANWVGSFAAGMGTSYLYTHYYSNQNQNLQPVMQSTIVTTAVFYVVYALCNLIAGYVAGAMAPANEVQHAVWVGVLIVITGVVWTMIVVMNSSSRVPFNVYFNPMRIAMTALIIPITALGGYLASGKSRNRHRNQY